jgi:hypothetical protein
MNHAVREPLERARTVETRRAIERKGWVSMRGRLRIAVIAATALVASAIVVGAAARPSNNANRFEATFEEVRIATHDRSADLGILQAINSGTGTVEGFGAATETLAVSQDRSVSPCGPGSRSNATIRRIVVAAGTLVLHGAGVTCPTATPGEMLVNNTFVVDGASSTGVFAGARGSGTDTVLLPSRTVTLSGKLHLKRRAGD